MLNLNPIEINGSGNPPQSCEILTNTIVTPLTLVQTQKKLV